MKPASIGSFILGVALLGCSSAPDQPTEASTDETPAGIYAKRTGRGDIDWISFEAGGRYALGRSGAASFEEGTYAFDGARSSITFRSTNGGSTTLPFAVGTSSGTDAKPAAYPLLGGTSTLTNQASSVLLDGESFELEKDAAFFCKDAANVSPMAGNCGARGPCAAGQIYCVKII